MTELEALKEEIAEKCYAAEPFAEAVTIYLEKVMSGSRKAILDTLDSLISARVDRMVQDGLDNNQPEEVIG